MKLKITTKFSANDPKSPEVKKNDDSPVVKRKRRATEDLGQYMSLNFLK